MYKQMELVACIRCWFLILEFFQDGVRSSVGRRSLLICLTCKFSSVLFVVFIGLFLLVKSSCILSSCIVSFLVVLSFCVSIQLAHDDVLLPGVSVPSQ